MNKKIPLPEVDYSVLYKKAAGAAVYVIQLAIGVAMRLGHYEICPACIALNIDFANFTVGNSRLFMPFHRSAPNLESFSPLLQKNSNTVIS